MFSPRTLILECGLDRVALAVFSARESRLCLHELAVVPLTPAASREGTAQSLWLDSLRPGLRALAKLTATHGPVTLILPAPFSLVKAIKIPRLEPAQRDKVLPFEAAENIPHALADVVWGSAVVGETTDEQELLLAAAKLELLEPLCAAVMAAGFEPHFVLPAALASLAGFRSINAAGSGALLGLHLGIRSTTLVLLEGPRLAVRSFSIEIVCEPPVRGAAPTVVAHSFEPTLTRLLQEITRSLLHFQWRSGLGKPSLVLLAGPGAALPGLVEALKSKFPGSIRALDLPGSIEFADEPAKRSAAHGTNLLDLIGAAAVQLSPNHAAVNLLPNTIRQTSRHRQRRPWLISAALLTLAVLLPPLVHFHLLTAEAQKKGASLTREMAPWRARESRIRENLQRLAVAQQQLSALAVVQERRERWVRLLAGLQKRLAEVEDAWLENLQLAPSPPGAPLKLLITGCMLDRADPLAQASPATFARVKSLFARFADAPSVAAIESERFEPQRAGVLRFECVLVTDPDEPL